MVTPLLLQIFAVGNTWSVVDGAGNYELNHFPLAPVLTKAWFDTLVSDGDLI